MVWIEDTLYCDGCGVEIELAPVKVHEQTYCCQDCANGLQCKCGERMELEERRRAGSEVGQESGIL